MAYRVISGSASQQGTPEWLAWRRQGLGASDAPVVMGRSKWSSPYQLFREKTGLSEGQRMNPAIMRGIRLEPAARQAYEEKTGNVMVPMVVVSKEHPILRASLDGLEFGGKTILEIKCPSDEAHALAMAGLVPDYYVDQVQQQLYVSGAETLHYWSYDGKEGALVVVKPDPVRIQAIIDESLRFWEKVTARRWETDEWEAAATLWRIANARLEEAKAFEEDARKALVSLLGSAKKKEGSGVSVTRTTRKGPVDYPRILSDRGITLTAEDEEQYRKPGSASIKVTESVVAEELKPEALRLPAAKLRDPSTVLDPLPFDETFILTI
ncbi:YqaJ viral recombinase family nuclease [Rubrivivax gelatinosus]|uniref:YqaJ viral recombinase family nuclease n=1 Tax=Rubrivivax gelatinosus TaxID=28068 RepID=UPI00067FC920|nr:YqaJ viral recombinase family protein [Rubrivivax gelatinosus]MBG6083206.1 putative phage-type endonuclease [Rubrivivax gelatinosus]